MNKAIQTTIHINSITLNQANYCLSCGQNTAFTNSFNYSSITPEHYIQLQKRGWKHNGSTFYNSSNTSCCHQHIIQLDLDNYSTSLRCKKAYKLFQNIVYDSNSFQDFTQRNNPQFLPLLKYVSIEKYRTNINEVLCSKNGFIDCLTQINDYFKVADIQISFRGSRHLQTKSLMKVDPHELNLTVMKVKAEYNLNISTDKRNIVHFRWPNSFLQHINQYIENRKKTPQSTLTVETGKLKFDEDGFNIYQQYYAGMNTQVDELKYRKLIRENQNAISIKIYDKTTPIALSIIDIVSNSMHRVSFYYNPKYLKSQIQKIGLDQDIKTARRMHLSQYYFGQFKKETFLKIQQQDEQNLDTSSIQQITLYNRNRQIQIKQLKQQYKDYFINLFQQLIALLGFNLIKEIKFIYY